MFDCTIRVTVLLVYIESASIAYKECYYNTVIPISMYGHLVRLLHQSIVVKFQVSTRCPVPVVALEL